MSVLRVRVINASSNQTPGHNTENFVVEIGSSTGFSTNNLIFQCTVTNVHRGDSSAFCLNREIEFVGALQGTVSECDVGFSPQTHLTKGGLEQQYAYNAHRTRDAIFSGNKSFGAIRAFNNDTHFNENLTISDNHFYLNADMTGLKLINGIRYSRVLSNYFHVQGASAMAVHVSGPYAYPYDTTGFFGANDILFEGNQVLVDTNCGWSNAKGFVLGYADQDGQTIPHHIELTNNVVDSRLINIVPTMVRSNALGVIFVGHMEGNTGSQFQTVTHTNAWRWPGAAPSFDLTDKPGDADRNGFTDITFQDEATTALNVWYMWGVKEQAFLPAPYRERNITNYAGLPVGPGDGLRVVGTGDVNGDGVSDLLFQNASGLTGWWTLTGSAGNQMQAGNYIRNPINDSPCNSGAAWKAAGCGDFTGDGKPDLLFQHEDKTLGIWPLEWRATQQYPNGCVRYMSPTVYPNQQPGSADWKAVAVADFNRDGKSDILFQHRGSDPSVKSAMTVWLMNGTSWIKSVMIDPYQPYEDPNNHQTPDLDWRVLGAGDCDGDRCVDLLFQKKAEMEDAGGDVMIWPMFGADRVARRPLAGFMKPSDWPAPPVQIPPGVFTLKGPR